MRQTCLSVEESRCARLCFPEPRHSGGADSVEKYCLNLFKQQLQQYPSTRNPIPLAATLPIEDGRQVEIGADDLHGLV